METPPIEDWVHPDIEIKQTANRGKGMFATKDIPQDTVVVLWGGNYVNKDQAEQAKQQGKLVMQFDEDLYSIEDRGTSNAYFINHSCNPNVWMQNAFTLETMRDIKKGEELTADYAMWETNEQKVSSWQCSCGAENCRGKVTGQDWQIPELQEKHKGHFLPLINKRIEKSKL